MSKLRNSREERQVDIKQALLATSRRYSGDVLLVPSAVDLCASLGRTTGYIGREGNYGQAIERLTGLNVIHNGYVLAGDVSEPLTSEAPDLSKLSNQELVLLIGSVANLLTSRLETK